MAFHGIFRWSSSCVPTPSGNGAPPDPIPALQKLIDGSKVVPNHALIDPVAQYLNRSSPDYDQTRTSLRRHFLDIIATSNSTKNFTYIFTNSRSSSKADGEGALDYEKAAAKRGIPFIPLILDCDLDENLKRTANRGGSSTTKLTDHETAETIRKEEESHRFGREVELEMDITALGPREAAIKILEHVKRFV
ncbi:hypothetical protein B0T14DRAFT_566695 [Immersiella caudata]|uniref:Uncharacterized protein n=1 Tax=Immersiella caudata TaxID=314043 RepID=A0AA39WQX4_9PEZI|nr:hypothetical protein B0T14DRAFT_566695 [Immersiella caudata]